MNQRLIASLLLAILAVPAGCGGKVTSVVGGGGAAGTGPGTGTSTITGSATGTATAATTETSTGTETGTLQECCQEKPFCYQCFAAGAAVQLEYFHEFCMCGVGAPCLAECGSFCEDLVPPPSAECSACAFDHVECQKKEDAACLADPVCAPYRDCELAGSPMKYCGS